MGTRDAPVGQPGQRTAEVHAAAEAGRAEAHVAQEAEAEIDIAETDPGEIDAGQVPAAPVEVGQAQAGRAQALDAIGQAAKQVLEVGVDQQAVQAGVEVEAQVAAEEAAPVHVQREGVAQVGARQVGADQGGPAQVGALEVDVEEVGALQVDLREVHAGEVRARQVDPFEVQAAQIDPRPVDAAEVGALEQGAAQAAQAVKQGARQVGAAEVHARQVQPAEVGARQVGAAEVEVAQRVQPERAEVVAREVKATPVQAAGAEGDGEVARKQALQGLGQPRQAWEVVGGVAEGVQVGLGGITQLEDVDAGAGARIGVEAQQFVDGLVQPRDLGVEGADGQRGIAGLVHRAQQVQDAVLELLGDAHIQEHLGLGHDPVAGVGVALQQLGGAEDQGGQAEVVEVEARALGVEQQAAPQVGGGGQLQQFRPGRAAPLGGGEAVQAVAVVGVLQGQLQGGPHVDHAILDLHARQTGHGQFGLQAGDGQAHARIKAVQAQPGFGVDGKAVAARAAGQVHAQVGVQRRDQACAGLSGQAELRQQALGGLRQVGGRQTEVGGQLGIDVDLQVQAQGDALLANLQAAQEGQGRAPGALLEDLVQRKRRHGGLQHGGLCVAEAGEAVIDRAIQGADQRIQLSGGIGTGGLQAHQHRTAQVGQRQRSIRQDGITQVGTRQVQAIQHLARQVHPGEVGSGEIALQHLGQALHARQGGAHEARGVAQHGPRQVGARQLHTVEARTGQVQAIEIDAREVEAAELVARQIGRQAAGLGTDLLEGVGQPTQVAKVDGAHRLADGQSAAQQGLGLGRGIQELGLVDVGLVEHGAAKLLDIQHGLAQAGPRQAGVAEVHLAQVQAAEVEAVQQVTGQVGGPAERVESHSLQRVLGRLQLFGQRAHEQGALHLGVLGGGPHEVDGDQRGGGEVHITQLRAREAGAAQVQAGE